MKYNQIFKKKHYSLNSHMSNYNVYDYYCRIFKIFLKSHNFKKFRENFFASKIIGITDSLINDIKKLTDFFEISNNENLSNNELSKILDDFNDEIII